jgi:hypothetical protein
VFLEDPLRIISGTRRAGKNLKNSFSAPKSRKNRWFFYKTKTCSLFVEYLLPVFFSVVVQVQTAFSQKNANGFQST